MRSSRAQSRQLHHDRDSTLVEHQNEGQKLTLSWFFWVDHELQIGGGPRVRFTASAGWSPTTDQQR